MDSTQEKELLLLARNGDNAAFEELISINFKKSRGVIQKNFNLTKHDLEDVIQNTSIKVWQHFKNTLNYDNFYNWFFTLFKNEAVRFLKQKNRIELNEINNVALDHEEPEEGQINIQALDFILQENARTFLEKKETIQQYQILIDELFKKLSNNHREIIDLVLVQEKSCKEIADTLNIPIGTVLSRFYYAKKESQKIINEYSQFNDIEPVSV